ncbi:hypothetical protein [Propionibacterium australiense]|uniref:P-loop containing nucleoside triphosphate hydrolase n=1 Tax=Propionibacterium australiense TaxID=119981 RepID=A0A383S6J0_9ACTN|nr:hypothetical protein [Propionibacterium australiense]RLP10103.1 hypothetical protein D9T14_06130 [Propionibacterium australiense]RLP11388.1 hypothetical protein D7U36_04570 [Propionibacterium australiense]SYZ33034.1 P-loop containing nucleoside triphosphate hydrolase [Propionibacterium australiense]VEH92201.1 Uncharacterised protein [Propionibacterium australiense]
MSTQSLLVAGTDGGAGTTTVAALIITLLRSRGIPTAARDHSGGTLGQRITPDGPTAQAAEDAAARVNEVQVTDAGRMEAAIADALEVPDFVLCLVSGSGVASAQTGRAALDGLLERFGQQARRRIIVVSNTAAIMRRRDAQLAREILRPDIELPRSSVLGSTGPLRLDLADKALAPVLDRLTGMLGELVRVQAPPPDEDWPTRITRMPKLTDAEPAQAMAAPHQSAMAALPDSPPPAPTRVTMSTVPDSPPEPDRPSTPTDPPARVTMTAVPDIPTEPADSPGPATRSALPARGAPPEPMRIAPAPTRGMAPEADDPVEQDDAVPARAARRAPDDTGEWDDPLPTGQERARRGDGLG